MSLVRALVRFVRRILAGLRRRLVPPPPPPPPAPPPWPLPQLPDRGAAADAAHHLDDGDGGLHPNRLGAVDVVGGVPDEGPWRDHASSVRAAAAAALVRLGAGAGVPDPAAAGRIALGGSRRPLGEDGPVVCDDEEQRGWVEWADPSLVGRVELADGDWQERYEHRSTQGAPRLGVVGYDLKFLEPLLAVLERRGVVSPDVDAWPKFRVHDEERTLEVLDRADVVLAEWCGPNAVLASHRVRADQRLVVRLHRFELTQPEWRDVRIEAVDAVVAVSEPYRRRILEVTGWPEEKVVVVPNTVDVHHLDRSKLASARFTLGMLGVDRSRKRLDRALDVLAGLRAQDPRWQLRIKGTSPWDSRWVADRPDEVAWFDEQLRRLDEQPLRSGVVLDPRGPDVATWLRGIGYVLSPSDDESFHLAPAEGMASGTVPVLWPWPGAEEIYDPSWVVRDAAEAVDRLAALAADPDARAAAGERARRLITDRYRLEDVAMRFGAVLTGG